MKGCWSLDVFTRKVYRTEGLPFAFPVYHFPPRLSSSAPQPSCYAATSWLVKTRLFPNLPLMIRSDYSPGLLQIPFIKPAIQGRLLWKLHSFSIPFLGGTVGLGSEKAQPGRNQQREEPSRRKEDRESTACKGKGKQISQQRAWDSHP